MNSSEDVADDQDARVTYLAGQIARLRRAPARGPLADLARARAIIRALDAYAAEQAAERAAERAAENAAGPVPAWSGTGPAALSGATRAGC